MKIAIVNDMPMAVEALRRALAFEPEHQVVWVASDGAEAVARCAEFTPDLILMDLIMPVMDGVEATRRIMAETPCAIVIVTVDRKQNVHRVFEAMGHGALTWWIRLRWVRGCTGSGSPAVAQDPQYRLADRPATPAAPRAVSAPLVGASQRRGLVAIGSSAGGPAALEVLLKGLPREFPASIVLVQHVDQVFASGMAEWLSGVSGLPVRLAREGEPPQPGQVLLAGTNHHIRLLQGGQLSYTAEPVGEIYRPRSTCSSRVWRVSGRAMPWASCSPVWAATAPGPETDAPAWFPHHRPDQQSSAVYGMPKAAAAIEAAVEIRSLERIAGRLMEIFSK